MNKVKLGSPKSNEAIEKFVQQAKAKGYLTRVTYEQAFQVVYKALEECGMEKEEEEN